MQQFIEMKQDSEFLLVLCFASITSGFIGFQFGEWEKRGFDKIVRADIRYRIIWLFRSIASWR